ncbi:hypothetical protein GCK72_015553 [Caenorhabditis remanei]|uniref:Uncharacterized protein n=1 Tax=Caenorhabditis remanei TaxID=31234 RepID=A0A6A5GXL4_CAERE|nr:hypothetical protein GCK72_015553 [Caenorhabditis remanei]KAF1759092.1 hypothetical protein GCK72_015553 [Caenorhabditis remanei]
MRVVEPKQHHEHGNKKLQDGGNTDADRELHSQRRSTYQMAQTDINNKCENTYNWNYANPCDTQSPLLVSYRIEHLPLLHTNERNRP